MELGFYNFKLKVREANFAKKSHYADGLILGLKMLAVTIKI